MKYLNEKGLSMSQAQSVSNICNQKAEEIENVINNINNYSTIVSIGEKEFEQIPGRKMPENIVELILQLGAYRELQAYLMEATKYKDSLIKKLEYDKSKFEYTFRESNPYPKRKDVEDVELKYTLSQEDVWNTLSEKEITEYLSVEAKASTIGKFIHKKGKLTELRKELPSINKLGWTSDPSGKESYPTVTIIHHTPDELFKIHEELSNYHRLYESRVNYYKAKVKNLLHQENTIINNENQKLSNEYRARVSKVNAEYDKNVEDWYNKLREETLKFVEKTDNEINKISKLRIIVPLEHKELIDSLLENLI